MNVMFWILLKIFCAKNNFLSHFGFVNLYSFTFALCLSTLELFWLKSSVCIHHGKIIWIKHGVFKMRYTLYQTLPLVNFFILKPERYFRRTCVTQFLLRSTTLRGKNNIISLMYWYTYYCKTHVHIYQTVFLLNDIK